MIAALVATVSLVAGAAGGYWLGLSPRPWAGKVRAFVSQWWIP